MLSLRHLVSVACVGAGILAAVGCNRDRADRERTVGQDRTPVTGEDRPTGEREPRGVTTVTGAGVLGNTAAIERIVAARCQREAGCKNIGAEKKHVSEQACVQKLKADMKDDLGTNECPRGIDNKELNDCLSAIHKEECNNPIDSISRLAACRSSELCLKSAAPTR
ncbi:MAG: hypothetical protein KF764_19585 [Labilithrix sp.]|nr:hypothetical protein [Labilithrix sp.]MBX3222680.1 hypothetical protein [Labilithrix sp.]